MTTLTIGLVRMMKKGGGLELNALGRHSTLILYNSQSRKCFTFQTMRSFTATTPLLLLILSNTLAWDGCGPRQWRCGNMCMPQYAYCNCGGTNFNFTAPMWCCQDSPCTARRNSGFKLRERKIGADCTGTALNLTQPCNQTCNYYEKDLSRNHRGLHRSYVPCQVANLTITQCIPEAEERDGVFNCKNRWDEEAFPNSSSLLLDLDDILKNCTTDDEWGLF